MEEADVRMIPHAVNATAEGSRRCVIVSGDKDVVVLALHFFSMLNYVDCRNFGSVQE
ncbi:hypothetical protein DPMN_013823 [Dreissena polymorpha]|uniref:Uncharacterized protein n=1 Tax=Dreissena polymorpha TaxID=45954 RepID=A0A9D4N650_DREPO|nr:hypothetical protein DPMN_013823 [Dreissena polymorpha]